MCGTCVGLLVVMVAFPISVPNTLPFSSEDFMVCKSRLTAHISDFPVFSFLSPVENFFCEIFLRRFLPYFLTMKSVLTGMLGELGACLIVLSGLQVTTKIILFPPSLLIFSPKCICSHFYLSK